MKIDTFEYHWRNNAESIPLSKISHAKSFLKFLKEHYSKNSIIDILDAGCGDGVHATVISEIIDRFTYTGVDFSHNAIKKCRNFFQGDDRYHFVLGDIGALDFPDSCFDVVFSYGVLAYTKNPIKTLKEMSRVLKPSGIIGIWIYPKPKRLAFQMLKISRFVFTRLNPKIASIIINFLVPFIIFIPTTSKVSLKNSSWKQCREVLMVNLLPKNIIFPEEKEVYRWCKECQLIIVENYDINKITLWLKKENFS